MAVKREQEKFGCIDCGNYALLQHDSCLCTSVWQETNTCMLISNDAASSVAALSFQGSQALPNNSAFVKLMCHF
jgi:hypothetical protein